MSEPLWEFIQSQARDYEDAVHFACLLRDVVGKIDPERGERVTDAIRRAHYEEALREALHVGPFIASERRSA